MRLQVHQPLLGLADGRDVPGLDPSERFVRATEMLEPLAPAAHHCGVRTFEDVGAQIVDRLPDRHIDDNRLYLDLWYTPPPHEWRR